jgi:DNA-binding response OmpR family regulator
MQAEGMIIVMADENLADHDKVKMAARRCNVNHVFTSVYNGSQLMDLLLKKGVYYTAAGVAPDLIIMEVDLPVISGFEVIQKMKSSEKLSSIPVYFLTRKKDDRTRAEAMKLGAAGFFNKPLKTEELQSIITGICSTHFKGK